VGLFEPGTLPTSRIAFRGVNVVLCGNGCLSYGNGQTDITECDLLSNSVTQSSLVLESVFQYGIKTGASSEIQKFGGKGLA